MEKGLSHETVQRMIDILGTNGDYETELTQVREGNANRPRSGKLRFWSQPLSYCSSVILGVFMPPKTTPNEYKPAQQDDATFLTEICTILAKEPAYRVIVEEIVREATNSLNMKLKALEKELLQLIKNKMAGNTRQRIDEQIKTERQDAVLAAKARLRSLIRGALDAEADHSTNRWVFMTSQNIPELTST